MRDVITILLIAGLGLFAGCVKVDTPETIDFNINDNTGGGGSGGSLPSLPENSGEGSMMSQAARAAKSMADSDFYADDVLTLPGKKINLVAHCDIEDSEGPDVIVKYMLDGKLLGRVKAAAEESTSIINWTPPGEGIYNIAVSASYTEEKTRLPKTRYVNLVVCVASAKSPMMIVDLDHTIVGSGFFKVVMRMAKPMPEAAAVMRRLAKRYTIVYLTHRPAMLTNLSKKWLMNNDFPAGPLLANQENEFHSGDYKAEELKKLRREFKNIQVGIGDKDSDMMAYRVNRMQAFWIIKYKDKRKTLEKIIKKIRPFRNDGDIQVVFDWEQIEQALDGQKSFSIKLVEKQLQERVRELRHIEKSKKDRDDDDDEDDD